MFETGPETRPTERHQAAMPPAPAGAGEGSFRQRLEARRATRPQSTLAIVSGIRYPAQGARAASAPGIRQETPQKIQPPMAVPERPRPAVAASAPARVRPAELRPAAPVAAPVPAPVRKAPVRKAPVLEAPPAAPAGERRAIASMTAGALPFTGGIRTAKSSGGGGGGADDGDGGTRIGDVSQIAFAGLAVLGLAGLSVMAAETALTGHDTGDGGEAESAAGKLTQLDPGLGPKGSGPAPAGEASALALADASQPVGTESQPWFDYKRLAYEIAARQEEAEAARRVAETKANEEAERRAAEAIAEAEAARLAEQQRLERAEEAARLAEAAAEKKRLAEAEARRVAEQEAIRQAELEAERQAEAEAEARRQAEIEARRLAEAEAETKRLAALEAKRQAELEAMRRADLEAKRKVQEEVRRQAALEAKRKEEAKLAAAAAADAAPEATLVSAAGVTPPPPASLKPASVRTMAPRPMPAVAERAPVVFTAYTGPVPAPASMKPERPGLQTVAAPVTRTPPETLTAANPAIRSFDRPAAAPVEPVSQKVEDFIARRVRTSVEADLPDEAFAPMKTQFLALVNGAQDGSRGVLITPDGREVEIFMEQTLLREVNRPVVRTVTYSVSEYDAVQRSVETLAARVPVQCRDIAYVIPDQERGRFAACESGKGDWLISRASDRPVPEV